MAFALVAGFRPPALPRLGAAPLALSPTTRCLIMPCMKSGKRAGGRALSNGPTEARALQSSPGKFRRLLSASRHRLLPVLIPAVVFATTVSRFAPAPVTQVQVQRSVLKKAAPLPSDNLDALAHLTYSVRYPISTRDLAHVKRDFLGADPSASAIKAGLDSISRKEALYSVAQSGKWTYPGWRSDLALALDGEVGEHGSFWLTTSSAGFFTGHGPRRSCPLEHALWNTRESHGNGHQTGCPRKAPTSRALLDLDFTDFVRGPLPILRRVVCALLWICRCELCQRHPALRCIASRLQEVGAQQARTNLCGLSGWLPQYKV